VNDISYTRSSKNAAIAYLDHDKVEDMDIRMTTEDFGFYSQKYPSCFYRFGVKKEKSGGLHTSNFQAEDTSLETSMGTMAFLAINFLNN